MALADRRGQRCVTRLAGFMLLARYHYNCTPLGVDTRAFRGRHEEWRLFIRVLCVQSYQLGVFKRLLRAAAWPPARIGPISSPCFHNVLNKLGRFGIVRRIRLGRLIFHKASVEYGVAEE